MSKENLPTTFKELKIRREELERSMKLNKFNVEHSLSDAGNELPKFLLKKVALPAVLVGLAGFGISKLMNNNSEAEEALSYQQSNDSTSLFTKVWMFALPFIQGYVKDFVKEKMGAKQEE